jgi:hypothetical protein
VRCVAGDAEALPLEERASTAPAASARSARSRTSRPLSGDGAC